MKIGELIEKLEAAKRRHGDLPISTWDGMVQKVNINPAKDGCFLTREEPPNEIALEIIND